MEMCILHMVQDHHPCNYLATWAPINVTMWEIVGSPDCTENGQKERAVVSNPFRKLDPRCIQANIPSSGSVCPDFHFDSRKLSLMISRC
jgi:hypothetical protein